MKLCVYDIFLSLKLTILGRGVAYLCSIHPSFASKAKLACKACSMASSVAEWTDCGAARLVFKDYGPHLPALNMNSTVYILEKL